MTAKAGIFPLLSFERGKRMSPRTILVALVIVAGLILYVGAKVKIVLLGYKIEALEREKQELERVNRSLLIESSSLMSPSRIEELATKRLGMVRPAKENIVVVKRKTAAR